MNALYVAGVLPKIRQLIVLCLIIPLNIFAEEDLVENVNPLIGTDSDYLLSHGNTYPSISLPFGMTSWTPQTNEQRWIYTFKADSIQGLRATHQPSPWISDYGSFTIMPLTGEFEPNASKRASQFRHENEIAKPYYYSVLLDRYNVKAELTPTIRCSNIRFTFPKSKNAYVLIDLHPKQTYIKIIPEEQKIVGYTKSNNGGVPDNFACYFVAIFNKPFKSSGTLLNEEIYIGNFEKEGDCVGAFLKFTTSQNEIIGLKIGTSFISINQAEKNLRNEIGDKSFGDIKTAARQLWNKALSKVQIAGCTKEQKITFYTALYRSQLFPRIWFELDENGQPFYFSPFDGKIHQGFMYTDTGFWDTFRSLFPLYTILFPEKDAQIIQGLINAYDQGGWFPKWMSPGYRDAMTGTFVGSIIADAYLKGIKDFDVEKAYEAMKKDATTISNEAGRGRVGIEYYKALGFVPANKVKEATTRTLEFAYGDFCVAQMAKALNKNKDMEIFLERAKNYQHVFDDSTGFMRGRNSDGSWVEPFNPVEWGGSFTEGCAWHYTFFVPHDVHGLASLFGGGEQYLSKLDQLFSTPSNFLRVGSYGRIIHEMTEMVLANMGQYAHGNQPCHHLTYLYSCIGEPWKTQKRVRKIMNELYGPGPDGLCGDEDNGSMSSWYIFSSLGFYPLCPGIPVYVFGSPLFKKAILSLPNDRKFIIETNNNSNTNKYIQSVKLNGESYQKPWISHAAIVEGGKLEFEMGEKPNKNWGIEFEESPFSLEKN